MLGVEGHSEALSDGPSCVARDELCVCWGDQAFGVTGVRWLLTYLMKYFLICINNWYQGGSPKLLVKSWKMRTKTGSGSRTSLMKMA
ncbi:hypothetical protein F2Q70_00020490 [Brassica cretica]|uniref:Uncharacterized protein n=1 Tax=Brassica cretica TaxID=69181 RepID=A0A8S9GNQ7_BRACR|nr:hypothetical protein F2Q70_00020490 [Brassica cretica]